MGIHRPCLRPASAASTLSCAAAARSCPPRADPGPTRSGLRIVLVHSAHKKATVRKRSRLNKITAQWAGTTRLPISTAAVLRTKPEGVPAPAPSRCTHSRPFVAVIVLLGGRPRGCAWSAPACPARGLGGVRPALPPASLSCSAAKNDFDP